MPDYDSAVAPPSPTEMDTQYLREAGLMGVSWNTEGMMITMDAASLLRQVLVALADVMHEEPGIVSDMLHKIGNTSRTVRMMQSGELSESETDETVDHFRDDLTDQVEDLLDELGMSDPSLPLRIPSFLAVEFAMRCFDVIPQEAIIARMRIVGFRAEHALLNSDPGILS